MASMSDWLEGQIRAHCFRTATFTKPTVLAIALCTGATTDAHTGATIPEVTNAGGYVRQTLNPLDANWTAASAIDGLTDNAVAITFPVATGNWGTITHLAICDNATWGAGNVLFHGILTASKTVTANDQIKFNIGDLDCVFS